MGKHRGTLVASIFGAGVYTNSLENKRAEKRQKEVFWEN